MAGTMMGGIAPEGAGSYLRALKMHGRTARLQEGSAGEPATDRHHRGSASLTEGKPIQRLGSQVVQTNARGRIEAVRQFPKPRHICLEEGTFWERLYEVLSPHAEEETSCRIGVRW